MQGIKVDLLKIKNMQSIVYNKDCMEVMKSYQDNYFDLAIVDPPYGNNDAIGIVNGNGTQPREKIMNYLKTLHPNQNTLLN